MIGALTNASGAGLYDLFCRVTGFGGTPMIGTAEAGTILDETVKVRFDANVSRALGWRFAAEAPQIEVRIGETQTVFYAVANPTGGGARRHRDLQRHPGRGGAVLRQAAVASASPRTRWPPARR